MKRYLRLLAPYRSRYLVGLLLLVLTNALSLSVPWLIKGAIDSLAARLDPEGRPAPVTLGGLLASPESYALALVVAALVLAATRTGSRVVILGAARTLARDLKGRLYDRLLEADPAFYSRFPTGEIMNRAIGDVRIAQAVAAPGVLYGFNAVFMFGIAVPYLFTVSWDLTAMLLVPYPFLAASTMWGATRVKGFAKRAQGAMDELTNHLQETLTGMQVVKAFTLEDVQAARFASENDVYLRESMKEAMARGAIGIAATLTGGIGTCLLLGIGGARVARGELTYGDLALYLSVMALVLRPTIFLGWILSLLQRGLASLERLDQLFDAELAVASPEAPQAAGLVAGALEVSDLSFRYPQHRDEGERRLALDGVSLTVPAGGVLGLTGRIGSGKSTLLRAIPRFLAAPEGTVRVDGAPVEAWDLRALRGGIGYVPQDGTVFSLSLGENVAFGRPDATRDEILAALKVAELEKDLDQLEDGLETVVGERGVTLSGGQRQRLAIARAVLIQPKVLLLDDALSMVDAETAVAVLANLEAILGETTVLVAAHRTATLLGCDDLVVLDQGRIVEQGAPGALLEQEGSLFAGMHERQRLQAEILEGS